MTQYFPSNIKYVFDPEKGLVQEIGDPSTVTFASGTIVEVSGVIAYVPEDPTQWAAIPTNLVQAVDYLAAGSGSGGGGGGGGSPGGSNGDIQYKVNATTFGGVNKLTFVAGNLVGTGSFNGVFSGSLTKLTDGSDYLLAGTNITLTTGSNGSVTIDGAGSIGGTIAANEVAFGIGGDAISGSPSFTWNASTYELTVADPAAIETLTLKVSDPGSGVSASINTTKVLDLQIPELQLNSNPGSTGQVLTSQGPGSAPIWSTPSGGGGTISGSIEVNEVAFGTATGVVSGSTNLNYNSTTGDLTIGDGVPHSIRIGPYGYVSNPIIESLESMNINIVNFGGALGIQAANNDLVLIGGDDGGGQSYLQTQPNVRLESKGRLLVQPATDGADAVEIKDSAGTYIIQVDSTTKTVSLTGDANPVLSLVDEISATPFLQITPSTREVSMSDPSIPTNTTVISTTDVAVADGVGTGNLSAQVIGVTDTGTTNKITLSSPGGEATLKADDGAGALIELHLSASSLTMQSLVASGDFFSVDASAQRLTVVDPGTGIDIVYLEGGRLTVDAAGNTLSFDAFTVPTITTLNVGSSLPMPLNLSIEALQINTDPGSAGYVLVSSGSGAAPVWAEAPYSAAVAGDWSGTAPTTIKEALDRIAAALGPIA